MPLNQKKTQKYLSALDAIENDGLLLKSISRYKQMLSTTLYTALEVCGWRWNKASGMWYQREFSKKEPAREVKIVEPRTASRRDKVLMRIITHKAAKDIVISEITELIEALNYSIETVSGAYENADGDYVRVYINMRRIEARGNQTGD
jgi:hypothetical protein